jgi:hypothetical protein
MSLGEVNLLDASLEFTKAKPLDIRLEDDWGKIDIFIDDGIAVTPDLGSNRHRAIQAMILAIHIVGRPLDPNEPILREDCLSLSKLAEEGTMFECFTLLGWNINTRFLTLALPTKKDARWSKDLQECMTRKKISFANLESLIG